jgi:hypothetical protein
MSSYSIYIFAFTKLHIHKKNPVNGSDFGQTYIFSLLESGVNICIAGQMNSIVDNNQS